MRFLLLLPLLLSCSRGKVSPTTSSLEDVRRTTDSALSLLEGIEKRRDTVLRVVVETASPTPEKDFSPVFNAVIRAKPDTVFLVRVDTVYLVR